MPTLVCSNGPGTRPCAWMTNPIAALFVVAQQVKPWFAAALADRAVWASLIGHGNGCCHLTMIRKVD